MNGKTAGNLSTLAVIRATLIIGALVALALLVWELADVILLAFAAALFAIMLRALAAPIERHTPIGPSAALAVAVLALAAVLGGFGWLLGSQVRSEVRGLVEQTPALLSSLGQRFGIDDLQAQAADRAREVLTSKGLAGAVASYTSVAIGVVANLVLVLVAGIYFARRPQSYRTGLLSLLPGSRREEARRLLDNIGEALRLWLVGQLVAMALVGALTTLGLYLIGMPSALALGLIAGVLEFIPLLGPVLSAIPALLLALSDGGSMVLWVVGLYLVVQQVEGNLIMPIVQRRAVDLPAALTLFSILSFGLLFGALGVLLSTPLTVAAYVAVKQLYVRRALGEDVEVPGEHEQRN